MSFLRALLQTFICLALLAGNGAAAYVLMKDYPNMRTMQTIADALLVALSVALIACALIALVSIVYGRALWLLLVIAGAKIALLMAGPFLFPEFSHLAAIFVLAELALIFIALRLNRVDNPDPAPVSPAEEFS